MNIKLPYLFGALLLAFILGGGVTSCLQPAYATIEEDVATPESYFEQEPIIPQGECYPTLKYEISQESEERKKRCGID